jgi:hypothetical protein
LGNKRENNMFKDGGIRFGELVRENASAKLANIEN